MSCYHPMLARKDPGQSQYKIIGASFDYEDEKASRPLSQFTLIPCGQCVGCRLDKSRSWADRCVLEYDRTKKACFLTLTYDDDHLPLNSFGYPTLLKSDMQTFMKDLRGNKYYDGKEIRFYGSGEYGSSGTQRPHLHLILFGLELCDFTDDGYIGQFHLPEWFVGRSDHKLYYSGENELHQPYYRCPHLESVIWKKGRCCLTDFSWETCAYVARYVRKKLTGDLEHVYNDIAIQPPFSLMSRRPGIAGYFFSDHPEKDFFEESSLSFRGKNHPLPKYLFDKLEDSDPDRYASVKAKRKQFADDRMLLELMNTDLSQSDYLSMKEVVHQNRSKSLVRNFEREDILY